MKVVAYKCPNCDASLKLKPGQTEGICEYCKSSFVIDDEVIRIEQKTTVEIKSDNDLEIAQTTLDNFKEYHKSEILFRELIERYGHKNEIYIGLVRSMTHDFKKQITNISVLDEINDFWEKYKSLAKPKEVSKYEDSMNELNKNYWHKLLIKSTGNFNYKKSNDSIEEIENNWNNYIKYCDKNEKTELQIKYNDFLKKKKNDVNQRNRLIKLGAIIVVVILLILLLIDYISLSNEKAKQKVKEINASTINENCNSLNTCENTDFLKDYFKETKSDLIIKEVSIDKENKIIKVSIELKNRYGTNKENYEFKLVDDMGPIISSNNCTYKDTEEVDVNSCFSVYDVTDGEIEKDKVTVDYTGIDFQKDGIKQITVTATDKENNTTTKKVDIEIKKTSMTLDVKLSKDIVVGETSKLTYTFNPDNIPNKEVEITYDNSYVSIDKNNNVKGIKKGTTSICVIAKYDNTKTCIDVNIGLKCNNTVEFTFSGAGKEKVVAGDNFCTGTYKIYASVLNKEEIYSIAITPKGEFVSEYVTIAKDTEFLNDEGDKYVFTEGTTITTEPGITKVRLVKVS